jgi:hypothetical protein
MRKAGSGFSPTSARNTIEEARRPERAPPPALQERGISVVPANYQGEIKQIFTMKIAAVIKLHRHAGCSTSHEELIAPARRFFRDTFVSNRDLTLVQPPSNDGLLVSSGLRAAAASRLGSESPDQYQFDPGRFRARRRSERSLRDRRRRGGDTAFRVPGDRGRRRGALRPAADIDRHHILPRLEHDAKRI